MTLAQELFGAVAGAVELGGPVVAFLIAFSVLSLAVILWKLWQLADLGAGRHIRIRRALQLWDTGRRVEARAILSQSRSHLAPILLRGMNGKLGPETKSRIEAEASTAVERLERGFRLLDSIAQIAPLLGLFGTILGMIEAFQALQDAGNNVDPSLLAGGIWVALLTTAVGLAVAMPTSVALTFFESRVARERSLAITAIETFYCALSPIEATETYGLAPAHAG